MKSQSELLQSDLDKTKVTLGVAAATFAFLFIQGGLAIWWAATMSSDMRNVKDLLALTTTSNQKDIATLNQKIETNTNDIKIIQKEQIKLQLEKK